MKYMNDYDIDQAEQRYCNDPVLSKAVAFLAAFRDEVNSHSDGWAYWRPPVQAAAKLMTLIEDCNVTTWKPGRVETKEATFFDLHKALTPIKAFYTRRGYAAGMKFPEVGIL